MLFYIRNFYGRSFYVRIDTKIDDQDAIEPSKDSMPEQQKIAYSIIFQRCIDS